MRNRIKPIATYWGIDGESGREILKMPGQCVIDCSGSGQRDADVEYWVYNVEWLADAETIRRALKGYGAWDADELADDDANQRRILWCLACNVAESDNPDDEIAA